MPTDPAAPGLKEWLDSATRDAVATQLLELAKTCRERDYNTEGIPMVLVLEDTRGAAPTGGDPIENALAALTGAWALQARAGEEVTPYDIATAFEVLAYRLLEPPADEHA